MKISLSLSIEKIENGFVVTHENTGRKRKADYEFAVAREVEQLVKAVWDEAVAGAQSAPEIVAADLPAPILDAVASAFERGEFSRAPMQVEA